MQVSWFLGWRCVCGAPLPGDCTTLSQDLSKHSSFLVTRPESEESLQPCYWQPISCRWHCALRGGQEIPLTDRNVISLCCPIAAGFSGLKSAFFPLNLNSHCAVCVAWFAFQLGWDRLRYPRAHAAAGPGWFVCQPFCLPVLDGRCCFTPGLLLWGQAFVIWLPKTDSDQHKFVSGSN